MKREMPWGDNVAVISSDDSSSSDADVEVDDKYAGKRLADQPANKMTFEDALVKRAEMYQEYMKQIPIPTHRGSVIPFSSWIGLGKSIKQLYGQPLHCLTNILLKEWDELRFHNEDTEQPLDTIIHPSKAEASVWLIEEVHRKTTSYHHLSKLWRSDPMYHAFIDSIFPKLRGGS